MSLLTIVQEIAINMGLDPQTSAQGDDPDNRKIRQWVNETGKELARRVDWSALTKTYRIDGLGEATDYVLPSDFDRFPMGMGVSASGQPVRGSLTADEWFSLTLSEGTPRYFWLAGQRISFYPYPAAAQPIMIAYQSTNWVSGGKPEMDSDDDQPVFPEALLVRGALARWNRHAGRDYADLQAEFEAMLADEARAQGGVRQP